MEAHPPRTSNKLRAIFFCDVSASSAYLIKAWLAAGHEVAACVVSHKPHRSRWRKDWWRRWLAPDWSLKSVLRSANVPLVRAEKNLQDLAFVAGIKSFAAAVLVSHLFPQRIPDAVTMQCRHGGVNLHPALLPHYRGPHPVQVMAVDNTLHTSGGVTLHRIVHGFDEGEIIVQARLSREDLAEAEWEFIAHARIGAKLLVDALPRYCAGEIAATPQPTGSWRYARLTSEDLVLSAGMNVADIALRTKILAPLGKLYLDLDGRMHRIGGVARTTQTRGARVRVTPLSLEFTARDGRIRLLREGRLVRRARDVRTILKLRRSPRSDGHLISQS